MKRLKNILIFVMAISLFQINAFAAEDIQVVFEQPAVYTAAAGVTLDYKLNINLPDNYEEQYSSFAITVLMDTNLDVSDQKLNGAEIIEGKINLTSTKLKNNTQSLITLSVNDVTALNGVKSFSVDIEAKVKEAISGADTLKNSFVLTYVDKNGEESSGQTNLESNTKAQEGILTLDDVFNTSKSISGKTESNATINVYVNEELIAEGVSNDSGTFEIKIEEQEVGTELSVTSLYLENETEKIISAVAVVRDVLDSYITEELVDENMATTIGEDSIKLSDYIKFAQNLNIEEASIEDEARIIAAIANAQYISIKTDVVQSEIQDAIEKLSTAISYIRQPIMSGKTDTTFAPTEEMKRSEVASVFTRIYAGEVAGLFSSFSDVSQSAWYADAVGYMERYGYMSGYKDGEFRPNQSITRAEFASVLVKISNLKLREDASKFEDVSETFWAKSAIDVVTSNNLMNGRAEGKFAPNEPITRAEVAKVLNALLERIPDEDFIGKYSINPFEDVSSKHWAYYEIMEITAN